MAVLHDNSEEPDKIRGVVTRIVYRSEDTGYTVCAIAPSSKARMPGEAAKNEVTVVGKCGALWAGETLEATGQWVRHRKHGYQFQAEQITCMAPVTANGIEAYLSSGMISGIGEVTAGRLVKAFGDDTLRVIDKESKRLLEVQGIGRKTRDKIKESWDSQRAIRDIMLFLRGHGVGAAHAMRIYRQYGTEAVALVMENPYRLCRDIWGIGFKSADTIAMNIGVPSDSDIRARAGVLHVLQTMADDGHCYCPYDELLESSRGLLGIPSRETLADAVEYEIREHALFRENDHVYLLALYKAEVDIARKMKELLETSPGFRPIDAEKAANWAAKRMKIEFAPSQIAALKMGVSEKVSVITGGPGVGKTTIMRAIVDVFKARKLAVSLAAPTGRAAKRLSEATGCPAMTLHRLLKFMPANGKFEHGPDHPLPGDVFIVDEVSMIDSPLMQSFLSALAGPSHLLLVGDSDQLPSVGPGNVLKDTIHSGVVPCTRLDKIFRQHAESWIVRNAHRVNQGEPLDIPEGDALTDFYYIPTDDPDDVVERMVNVVAERIPKRFGMNPTTDIQVLTPMRRNQLGADNLNAVLQKALNPHGTSIERFGRVYRIGDRVMQIRNNYDKEVFNGDIGVIASIDTVEQTLVVNYDGRRVSYEVGELDELVLSYACSIHKSQGSEYPAVVVLMATQHFKLLQRNLLYTALTRGRKLVCLIGSSKAIYMAIKNNHTTQRRTALSDRLRQGLR
jgi:exodeoxyribonuclease V alpha subunit